VRVFIIIYVDDLILALKKLEKLNEVVKIIVLRVLQGDNLVV
jgi:hypothetical protein